MADDEILSDENDKTPPPSPPTPGVCATCGAESTTPRSTFCEDHRPARPIAVPTLPPVDTKRERTPQARDKGKEARAVSKVILSANPYLVNFAARYIDAPPDWLDNEVANFVVQKPDGTRETIVFWKPVLRKQLELTKKQADTLAKAWVDLSDMPQMRMFANMASAFAPYAVIGSALAVVGMYVHKVGQLGQDVKMLKEKLEQSRQAAAQASQASPSMPQPFTGGDDTVNDNDEENAPDNFEG